MLPQQLVARDELQKVNGIRCPAFRHLDHRWTLPMIHAAQRESWLPKPCTLVTFDAHTDALPPRDPAPVANVKRAGVTEESLLDLCDRGLSELDDDWIAAGMELGLVDHAIVFGVQSWPDPSLGTYTDAAGSDHEFFFPPLPGRALEYQGDLSDLTKRHKLEPLWNRLQWEVRSGDTGFIDDASTIALDFDLDCFVMHWDDYTFPWPDEIWEKEFFQQSTYHTTRGLTGRHVVDGLLARAGMVTFAMEPSHCGGRHKADAVWQSVRRHLFDEALSLAPIS